MTAESGTLDATLPDNGTEYTTTLSVDDGAVAVATEHLTLSLTLT